MYLYQHGLSYQHKVPQGHPERPARLESIMTHLTQCGLLAQLELREAPAVTRQAIMLAHPTAHFDFLQQSTPQGDEIVPIDPDTWLSEQSLPAAVHAAGAVQQGIDDLMSGLTNRVFCAMRPPGHHAEHNAAMGFCLLNSIAIGALHALAEHDITRVAILDFDVHHGNGTVDICQHHPDILVCSSFQHPYYPHRLYDVKQDNIVNTPLPAGTQGPAFRQAIERDWLHALNRHQPDLILVSAGFDAHVNDPLANLALHEEDFEWLTEFIIDAANQHCGGRVLATLEGGYDLDALARSVETHLRALMA